MGSRAWIWEQGIVPKYSEPHKHVKLKTPVKVSQMQDKLELNEVVGNVPSLWSSDTIWMCFACKNLNLSRKKNLRDAWREMRIAYDLRLKSKSMKPSKEFSDYEMPSSVTHI